MKLRKPISFERPMALPFMAWAVLTAGVVVNAAHRQASLEKEKEELEATEAVNGLEIRRLKKENAALREEILELKRTNSLLQAAMSALNNQGVTLDTKAK